MYGEVLLRILEYKKGTKFGNFLANLVKKGDFLVGTRCPMVIHSFVKSDEGCCCCCLEAL